MVITSARATGSPDRSRSCIANSSEDALMLAPHFPSTLSIRQHRSNLGHEVAANFLAAVAPWQRAAVSWHAQRQAIRCYCRQNDASLPCSRSFHFLENQHIFGAHALLHANVGHHAAVV